MVTSRRYGLTRYIRYDPKMLKIFFIFANVWNEGLFFVYLCDQTQILFFSFFMWTSGVRTLPSAVETSVKPSVFL